MTTFKQIFILVLFSPLFLGGDVSCMIKEKNNKSDNKLCFNIVVDGMVLAIRDYEPVHDIRKKCRWLTNIDVIKNGKEGLLFIIPLNKENLNGWISILKKISRPIILDCKYSAVDWKVFSTLGLELGNKTKNVKELNLFCCFEINDLALYLAVSSFENLESIVLVNNGITDFGLDVFRRAKNLKKIMVKDCNDITDKWFSRIEYSKKLKEIDVTGCLFITGKSLRMISKVAGLTDLTFVASEIQDEDFCSLGNLKNLKTLYIYSCDNVTDDALKAIGVLMKLRELSLCWGKNITNQGLQVIRKLQKIEKLSLCGFKLVDKEGLQAITALGKLQGLEIASWNVSDDDLKFIQKLSNLKEVMFLCLYNITSKSLDLLEGLKKIKKLELYRCTKIKSDHLKELREKQKYLEVKVYQ
jgi:hypothetical protein